MIVVRHAEPEDAKAAIQVVRYSIEELCIVDHHNDADTLAHWLANKTPEHFRNWIANSDNFCVVAEEAGSVRGVGLLHRSGEIRLFYLDPGVQRRGIGRAIHSALEKQARVWKLPKLHLDSTVNARPFYEAIGYKSAGAAKHRFDALQCYPYEKVLRY